MTNRERKLAILAATVGGGGTDTSDATATAGDILVGKTAYVNDEKITGTLPDYVPKINIGLSTPAMPDITENAEGTTV